MAERNYYMVRAMSSSEADFNVFFENSVVAVGWSSVNFKDYKTSEDLRNAIYEEYYKNSNKTQNVISRKLNEAERFKNIKAGDYIIVPYWSGIAIAIAGEEEEYSEDAGKNCDLANWRMVKYCRDKDGKILRIPRENLEYSLQRRLRVYGTAVSDLYEFRDDIEEIFDKKEKYSYRDAVEKKEDMKREEFKKNLLWNIQNKGTNLKAGGIGLEQLVCELLECEGYTATIIPKKTYKPGTDADIKASRSDPFRGTEKVYVQVKHHTGHSDKTGIEQLQAVEDIKDDDCVGVFVTSASVDEDLKIDPIAEGIKIIEGQELVDIIVDNLGKLKPETKRTLGICDVPSLITD